MMLTNKYMMRGPRSQRLPPSVNGQYLLFCVKEQQGSEDSAAFEWRSQSQVAAAGEPETPASEYTQRAKCKTFFSSYKALSFLRGVCVCLLLKHPTTGRVKESIFFIHGRLLHIIIIIDCTHTSRGHAKHSAL